MGLIPSFLDPLNLRPKWFDEFSWKGVFGGVKEDIVKIPTVIGKAAGDIIEGSIKPAFAGVRKALTPTLIWAIVLIIIGLLLYTWFRKTVKI